jgi:hypothetical protein
MSTSTRLPRWARNAAIVAIGALIVGVLFGYARTDRTFCAACGAMTKRSERGVALSLCLRVPLLVTDEVTPMPNTLRFLPPDHVHGREMSVGFSQTGPFLMGGVGSGRRHPGEFAYSLAGTPGFADFIASRVDAGTVDAATVRALIAEPSTTRGDDTADARHQALVRSGSELIAEFRGIAAVANPAAPVERR